MASSRTPLTPVSGNVLHVAPKRKYDDLTSDENRVPTSAQRPRAASSSSLSPSPSPPPPAPVDVAVSMLSQAFNTWLDDLPPTMIGGSGSELKMPLEEADGRKLTRQKLVAEASCAVRRLKRALLSFQYNFPQIQLLLPGRLPPTSRHKRFSLPVNHGGLHFPDHSRLLVRHRRRYRHGGLPRQEDI
ncbi:uncharacterized protein F4822DRAFT_427666 [Hypoxylon trugodes]|uniref:uncharacterized protein n=1 Tax=Hypoxylon trugodes TaxID=326681 RepID=UPI00219DFC84|nr:uncharacterized protein F4822DRAFT_427666 [Hypoxylon trugodes]KAI1389314.1 hypothetical protein F4822DRAFT_427666 [Hypoxylon trugodes]